MFVLMGLSAVFPVLHGLEMYGFEDMRHRIGLTWMLLQGFMYILGAGLYAVSTFIQVATDWGVELFEITLLMESLYSLAGQRVRRRDHTIFGEVLIRFSMSLW